MSTLIVYLIGSVLAVLISILYTIYIEKEDILVSDLIYFIGISLCSYLTIVALIFHVLLLKGNRVIIKGKK